MSFRHKGSVALSDVIRRRLRDPVAATEIWEPIRHQPPTNCNVYSRILTILQITNFCWSDFTQGSTMLG